MRTGDDVKITGFTVVEKSDEDETEADGENTENAENPESTEIPDETARTEENE